MTATIAKLRKRINLTLEQDDIEKKEFFRVQQRDSLNFKCVAKAYKQKSEKKLATYKRKRLANKAKVQLLKDQIRKQEEEADDHEITNLLEQANY